MGGACASRTSSYGEIAWRVTRMLYDYPPRRVRSQRHRCGEAASLPGGYLLLRRTRGVDADVGDEGAGEGLVIDCIGDHNGPPAGCSLQPAACKPAACLPAAWIQRSWAGGGWLLTQPATGRARPSSLSVQSTQSPHPEALQQPPLRTRPSPAVLALSYDPSPRRLLSEHTCHCCY